MSSSISPICRALPKLTLVHMENAVLQHRLFVRTLFPLSFLNELLMNLFKKILPWVERRAKLVHRIMAMLRDLQTATLTLILETTVALKQQSEMMLPGKYNFKTKSI